MQAHVASLKALLSASVSGLVAIVVGLAGGAWWLYTLAEPYLPARLQVVGPPPWVAPVIFIFALPFGFYRAFHKLRIETQSAEVVSVPEAMPEAGSPRWATVSLYDVVALYRGRTHIQGDKLAEPQFGKWFPVAGTIDGIYGLNESAQVVIATVPRINLTFSNRSSVNRLLLMSDGDFISAAGQLDGAMDSEVSLDNCVLIDAPTGGPAE